MSGPEVDSLTRLTAWERMAFLAFIAIPSVSMGLKWFHPAGFAIYLLVVLGVVGILFPSIGRGTERAFSEPKVFRRVVAVAAVLLAVLFFFGVRLSHAHIFGQGSDREAAIDIALGRMTSGLSPYGGVTYFGNPITDLPGALLIAFPFWSIRVLALQNLFWIGVFFLLTCKLFSKSTTFLLCAFAFFLSIADLHETIVGGDYFTNSIYVAVLSVMITQGPDSEDSKGSRAVVAAVLFGFCLCSRLSYLLLLVPIGAFLWRTAGWKRAFLSVGAATLTTALLTLAFYLWDPAHFSPFHVVGKLRPIGGVNLAPLFSIGCLAMAGVGAAVARSRAATFLVCAALLSVPFVISAGLNSFAMHEIQLYNLDDGLGCTVFACLGFGFLAKFRGESQPVAIG